MSDPEDTLPPGTQLGRYQIVRLLGRGGMATVYEATHRDLKKQVAIKTLHPAVAAMPGARARFLREGEAASRIRHPNVVDVTDVGTEAGVAYLVMEFLEGEDLGSLLERVSFLPVSSAIDLLLPVFAAISVAHDEGVIHRDLKPQNIFLARTRHSEAEPKVLDFGISKLSSSGGGNTLALTGTGASLGTPYYVAPEQVRSAAGVDARSDQYALGAILYECVTGHRAHQGETIYEVIRSVGEGSFPPPRAYRPDLPVAVEDAILRAMRLDPGQRFPSVQGLARAVLSFASPGARAKWASVLQGDSGVDDARSSSASRISVPQQGQTVLLTPAPGNEANDTGALRTRSRPPVSTTLGSSAAQVIKPARNRSALLVGGFLVLAAAAVVAYVVTSPAPRQQKDDEHRAKDIEGAETLASKAPARYHVSVSARPREAELDLDGKNMATGALDQDLAADGTEHTLLVRAAGFVPARLTFRDRPPPEQVTLEPVRTAPPRPVEAAAVTAVPVRSPHPSARAHAHGGDHAAKSRPAPTTAARPAELKRTENNAAIIED